MEDDVDISSRVARRHLLSVRRDVFEMVPVRAKLNNGRSAGVDLVANKYNRLDDLMVKVDGTRGSWYMQTFMKGRGPLLIDGGTGLSLENADEVRKAISRMDTDALKKRAFGGGLSDEEKEIVQRYVSGVEDLQNVLTDFHTTMSNGGMERDLGKKFPNLAEVADDIKGLHRSILKLRNAGFHLESDLRKMLSR